MQTSFSARLPGQWISGLLIAGVFGVFGTAAAACPDWSLTGQQLTYSSDELWTPRTHAVTAGGTNDLNACPQPGRGWVATRPDFDLSFTDNSAGRDLEFRVDATCDSVLLVNDASGQWHFDDDSGDGLNSRIRLPNTSAGTYDIWVGTYGSTACAATITFETVAGPIPQTPGIVPVPPTPVPPPPQVAACPDPGQNGQILRFNARALSPAQRVGTTAGGLINLADCQSVPGHGRVRQRPDYTLDFTNNRINHDLDIRTEGSCDPVLLIHDPFGNWHFNDDRGGLNAGLRLPGAQPGQYDIWVGTFGSASCASTLVLETLDPDGTVVPPPPPPPPPTAACPDPGRNGRMLRYDAQGLWTPQRFGVVAGGPVNLGACQAAPGHGWVAAGPDFTLALTGNRQNRDLEFRVEGSCDPVLLIHDASGGWHFNDDDNGLNSRLRLERAQPGQYDIWVGTFGSQTCQATLVVESLGNQVTPPPPPPPPPVVCPMLTQSGQPLSFRARDLRVAQSFGMTAGGAVDLGACQSVPGHGHISQRPSFTLSLSDVPRNDALEFRVEGRCDPVVLVHDPAGGWHFNDDDAGLNSRLRLSDVSPGRYDIWVGTFGSQACQASLIVQSFGTTPPPPPPTATLPDPGNLTAFRSRVGETLRFEVTGAATGSLWGTGIYTDDSSLSRAAVHAGVLRVGQTGVVTVTVLPGQASYQGTTQNGVESRNYGSWTGSYQIHNPVAPPPPAAPLAAGTWRVSIGGWTGRLVLTWGDSAWSGTLTFDTTGTAEPLTDIRFDPSSGAVQFTRPVPAATQAFRGFVSANEISGQFSILNGPFSHAWSATR